MTDQSSPYADPACLALHWAGSLLNGLVAGGVRQLLLSPGSRSTPLVLAAEQNAQLQLTPIVDERSAAFFALGLARASRRPVALLATSGSAPAHWHPAVIEAHEWGVPLILLSADRPPALIGWGANQTTPQHPLFRDHLRAFHDPGLPNPSGLKMMASLGRRAAATSCWPSPGPVHINLPFDEPLVPSADCAGASHLPDLPDLPEIIPPAPVPPSDTALQQAAALVSQGKGLILCGPGDYTSDTVSGLVVLSHRLDAPVLADPLSGLRHGGPDELPLVTRYDALLRNPRAAQRLRPDWVLRLGRPPVSRILQEWLADVPVLLADPHHRWLDPAWDCHLHIPADPGLLCEHLSQALPEPADRQWSRLWVQAEQRCSTLATAHLEQAGWFEGAAIDTLLPQLPSDARLLLGNSLPIRHMDTWSGSRARPLRLLGNRGVSGIDGQPSTLAGIAAATDAPCLGLIGDLSLFHDLTGLELARRFPLTLVVINNGGGRIFDYLPQHKLPGLQAHWHTPTGLAPQRLAEAFGIAYRSANDPASLSTALADAIGSSTSHLVEVVVNAELSQRETLAYWQTITDDPLLSELS